MLQTYCEGKISSAVPMNSNHSLLASPKYGVLIFGAKKTLPRKWPKSITFELNLVQEIPNFDIHKFNVNG